VERQKRAEYEVAVTGPDQFEAAVAQVLDKSREPTDALGSADVEPAAQPHVALSQPVPSGATVASASGVRAWFDFQPPAPGELRLRTAGVAVLKPADRGGEIGSPRDPTGRFPPSHVKTLPRQPQDAVRQDAQEEQQLSWQSQNPVERSLSGILLGKRTVWVMVRIKGVVEVDHGKTPANITCVDGDPPALELRSQEEGPFGKISERLHSFRFDHVFDSSSSNRTVFERIEPLILAAFEGHVCLIVDGQSGTGKSWTMFDGPDAITSCAVVHILSRVHEMTAQG